MGVGKGFILKRRKKKFFFSFRRPVLSFYPTILEAYRAKRLNWTKELIW
jgi:hypothetical protein